EDAEQGSEHRTHVVTGHDGGRGAAAATLACVLRGQGDRSGQATTESEPGQEPEQAEDPQRGCPGTQSSEYREARHRVDHDLAASDDVGDGPDEQGTDRHACESGRGDRGGAARGETPLVLVEKRGEGG